MAARRGRVFSRIGRVRLLSRRNPRRFSSRPSTRDASACRSAARRYWPGPRACSRKTAGLWIRPIQHDVHQLGLLLRVERGRPTIAPAVGEAVDPMLVVAQHPVAQRLPVHACRPALPLPGSCRRERGDRQDAALHTRVGLGLAQLAKNCRRAVLAYLQRSHDALPQIIEVRESEPRAHRITPGHTRDDPLVWRYHRCLTAKICPTSATIRSQMISIKPIFGGAGPTDLAVSVAAIVSTASERRRSGEADAGQRAPVGAGHPRSRQ